MASINTLAAARLSPNAADPAHKPVVIRSITTDTALRISPQGNGRVRISSGIGGPIVLHGGIIGLALNNRNFSVATISGQPVGPALNQLHEKIQAAGFQIKSEPLPTIDTLELCWTIS